MTQSPHGSYFHHDGIDFFKQRVDRVPCSDCGSSDAVSVYTNKGKEGETYLLAKCFSCGEVTHETKFKRKGYGDYLEADINNDESVPKSVSAEFNRTHGATIGVPQQEKVEFPEFFTPDKPFQGIDPDVFERYSSGVQYNDPSDPAKPTFVAYTYFDNDLNLVALKSRNYARQEKREQFNCIGNLSKAGMFGKQLFKQGGKFLTIVEGEKDCLSAFQMLGKRTPVISVKNGATSLTSEIQKDFEYINSFSEIRICMDPDEPGRQAAKKFCESNLIHPSKIKVVKLNLSVGDVNDYLTKGMEQEFKDLVFNAHPYTPDDIFLGNALIDQCLNEVDVKCYKTPFNGFNDVTYGLRKGELDVWVAETGVGKSTVFKHLVRELLVAEKNEKVAMFIFEELPKRTLKDLVGLEMGRRLHLPNQPFSSEDFKQHAKNLNLENLIIWGNFGSTDVDVIMRKLEYVVAQGCEFIFLDHISMITADQRNQDERAALDQIINYLNNFVTARNVHISVIAHTNRQGLIRGTAGIEKVAHKVTRIDREKEHPDPILRNVIRLSVEKNRFNGDLGPAGFLEFNSDTGRLEERLDLDDETFYAFKQKQKAGSF